MVNPTDKYLCRSSQLVVSQTMEVRQLGEWFGLAGLETNLNKDTSSYTTRHLESEK